LTTNERAGMENNSTDLINVLGIGQKYSKKDLADLLDEPRLASVREGVASCTKSNSYLLFVDLEKEIKKNVFISMTFLKKTFSIGIHKQLNT
jgi:hypothetical protein